jgi:hypothetical protein
VVNAKGKQRFKLTTDSNHNFPILLRIALSD